MFFLRRVNQRRPMTGVIVSGDQCDHAAGDNLSCLGTSVLTGPLLIITCGVQCHQMYYL